MNRFKEAHASGWLWSTLGAAALIVACGLAAYSNSFTDLFVGLDGKESIRDNPHIRHLWPLSEALSLPLCGSAVVPEQHPAVACRPMFSLLLALTHHFFGLEPAAYHGVNLALHIAASLALYGVVRQTLRRRFEQLGEIRSTWLALAAALIWLLHPLQTESVTYVVQISETLMGSTLLLTLYCAIRSRDAEHRRAWQVGTIAAYAFSLGSKQNAIVAPLLVLLYDHTFVSGPVRGRYRPLLYSVMAVMAAASVLALPKVGDVFSVQKTVAYAVAQPGVILHYLRLALWPDDLFLYVNTTLFVPDSAAQVLLPGLLLVGLAVATLYGIARRRWYGFLGGWFFLTLAPTSSVIPITDRIQEHRMYLPLAALVVLVVVAGDAFLRDVLMPRLAERRRAVVEAGMLLVVLVGLGLRTYIRNCDYHHEFTMIHPADLHEDYAILADHYLSQDGLIQVEAGRARAVLSAPERGAGDVPFAHFILGLAYERSNELQKAAGELEGLLQLEPEFAYGHHWLGMVLRRQGDLSGATAHLDRAIRIKPTSVFTYKELALVRKEEGDTAAAREMLQQALRIDPGFAEAYYELGIMAVERRDPQDAANQFQRAVRYQPDFAEAHYELALLLRRAGDKAGSIAHLTHATRVAPDLVSVQVELARLLAEQDDLDAAERHLRHAVREAPELANPHYELGVVLAQQEKREEAAQQLERAIEILEATVRRQPAATRVRRELAQAHNELGMALAQQDDPGGASEHFAAAIRLRPDFAEAHTEFGIVLRDLGKEKEAIEHFQEAIRLRPDSADAYNELGFVLRDREDWQGAAQQFEQVVRLQPDSAEAHNELGWALLQRGDLKGAAEHFQRAVVLQPDFAEARERLEETQTGLADADRAHTQSPHQAEN